MDNECKVPALTENTLQFKFTVIFFYHYYMVHYQQYILYTPDNSLSKNFL